MANAAVVFHEPSQAQASSWRRLLAPIDPDVFLNEYFGEKPLYIPGEPGKLADLFSWSDLNSALDQDLIPFPHVRLIRGGKYLSPKSYCTKREWHLRPDASLVLKEMSEGATLYLTYGDRLTPKLREFTRSLERELRAVARIDVLAGCSPVRGFGVHWDPFECFNVQLSGTKLWKLYKPQRPYPMKTTFAFPHREDVVESGPPSDPPIWEGILRPGDLIYVPRGWWHHVSPEELPSLHLSVTLEVPAGSDLLHWLADHLKTEDLGRKSVPYWKSAAERGAYLRDMRETVAGQITSQLLDQYLGHLDETAAPQPTLSLPSSVNPGGPSLRPGTVVRFRPSRKFSYDVDPPRGVFRFQWKGKSYEFSTMLLTTFQTLNAGAPQTVDQLSAVAPAIAVKAFLFALWRADLVSIADSH
jgi:ribosomal protein L16 Arg81 hydroxylase